MITGQQGRAIMPVNIKHYHRLSDGAGSNIYYGTPSRDYTGNADAWDVVGDSSTGYVEGGCNFYEAVDGVKDKFWYELVPLIKISAVRFAYLNIISDAWGNVYIRDDFSEWTLRAKYGLRLDGDTNVLPDEWTYEITGPGSGGVLDANDYMDISADTTGATIDVQELLSNTSVDIRGKTFISGVAIRFEWDFNLSNPGLIDDGLQGFFTPFWHG